jgi:hypothetical protein
MNRAAHIRERLYRCAECAKFAYPSRRSARRAFRALHPEDSKLVAYPCPGNHDVWHFGHRYPTTQAS